MKGRTYRYMSDPLFPFGFGLSYTSFSIGNAQLNKTTLSKGDDLKLTIPVSNTGKRNGTEILQVYIKKVSDTSGLIKTLKGFERMTIPAGKTEQARITLPYNSFEFYDDKTRQMHVAPGEYNVWYGSSSDSKDLKLVKLTIDNLE
jgi:beta-glucosidase